MSKRKGKPSILVRFLVPILFGVLLALAVMASAIGLMGKYEEYRNSLDLKEQMEVEREATLQRTKQLRADKEKFQADEDFLIEIAHELGFAGPNEFRVDFEGETDHQNVRLPQ